MRLLLTFATLLALSLAESEHEHYEDLVAAESIELQKTDLKPEASLYTSVPYPSNGGYIQTHPPRHSIPPSPGTYVPPPPSGSYIPPSSGSYIPGFGVQSDYVHKPQYHPTTTTTPVPVIKNEQLFGDNGSYKYEYQIADGTWVGEEGWFTNPKKTDESLVKKGWYQFIGGDGKTYTVTYWADHTGYHASGAHLPVPPPIPPAIQASIDQNAKEEAAKAEAEKNKPYYPPSKPVYEDPPQQSYDPTSKPVYFDPPQQPYYPPQNQQPQQTYYPAQQTQQPQQTYYPPQQTYYPQTNYPSGK